MIAAKAEAMGLGAALVVRDVHREGGWKGVGEEARAGWPGGPIPLGCDGAYGGRCDSWDSFNPFP